MHPQIDTVHVIFKTHFDLGFTDFARNVIDRYMTKFIPDAIDLARAMQRHHAHEPFCWTVGSWLIHEYLQRANSTQRAEIGAAIDEGLVTWHALPFTTHTELMDARLFRYGLSISQQLDRQFGKNTIAGKMTDVPGHTRAMLPLLAEAGIRLFHVGVNPAATVPDVPDLFIWRDEATNTEVITIYQQVYGDILLLPGTTQAMVLIFTGDNLGPPSKASVHETYARLRQQFPNATFIGSSLDEIARILIEAKPDLPVIASEIGDTWIHGIGTDPTKVSQYRELLRLRDEWLLSKTATDEELTAFHQALLMIPEHTWGMDLKTHLKDYEHYQTTALAQARVRQNFRNFEASWVEQRGYINQAVMALPAVLKQQAQSRLEELIPTSPNLKDYQTTQQRTFDWQHWQIGIDKEHGVISDLVHKATGRKIADQDHQLASFIYETFSTADYERYWQQYIRDREFGEVRVWAHPDNTKPGLEVPEHQIWQATLLDCYVPNTPSVNALLIRLALPQSAQHIGAPREVFLHIQEGRNSHLLITLQWFNKPACRLPEAFWMGFRPIVSANSRWAIHKLNHVIDPTDVISNGARTLHGFVDNLRCNDGYSTLYIRSMDAVLVAPNQPSLLDFHNRLPAPVDSVAINLYNNVWGTNFPMWFEDDARFRFELWIEAEHINHVKNGNPCRIMAHKLL